MSLLTMLLSIMPPELRSASPHDIVSAFKTLLKDERTTERSATLLVQAEQQFGQIGSNALQTFGEIVKYFQSRWWPHQLADYQPSAVMTYTALAFKKPTSEVVDDFKIAEKMTGDSDAASNLVALAISHSADLGKTCKLALEIYNRKTSHPYRCDDPATAVMLTSAELMSSREHVVAVLDRVNQLKKWESSDCSAILSQAILAPGGDLESNFDKVKLLFDKVNTRDYKKTLGIDGDVNISLIIMSCIMGDLTPEAYARHFKVLTSSGCEIDEAVRLCFGHAAESKGVIATCSISTDYYMMGEVPTHHDSCTALILKYPSPNT